MDVDQEDKLANTTEETPKTLVIEKAWSKEKPVDKKAATPEEALLQELDHLKIPTTFAHLAAISLQVSRLAHEKIL
ncbi:uncharacterized protein PGTG_21809 [Puccinia graminis f. sp. tritici CRL 75-36-700-3]|uniref:Uncharacterized protein n=1 Tax=Puccinia graminis f. sp. tritici (strain CRL 75-36-700-3 / race SCCL) TaxID=418459 RepID=H6QSQ2_PUCGT|nr:uncharacterized protein PGTG_21809 [Puccinia graminis f. sp. tritici CRL 75-36-700-3]EHS63792.1 hypothetical protein PGTG_21809 [Puccinia graminis f. sp. tritici CRL 75-36-700-3]